MDFPPYSLQADQTQKVIVTSIISQILEEVESISKFIFPLQMSATDGKYHNYFGEFSEDSLIKDGSYELGISECRSGLFHLEGLSQEKVPAAKHLQIICPHHCQHELEAINRNTLICSQCDPRLAHIEGGM